jgi:hypothetical protein
VNKGRTSVVVACVSMVAAAFAGWFVRFPRNVPACLACRTSTAVNDSASDTTVEAIVRNSNEYAGKVVRVHARLHNDSGRFYLQDLDASRTSTELPADLPSNLSACAAASSSLRLQLCLPCCDGEATLVVVGRVGPVRGWTEPGDNAGLTIRCIERLDSSVSAAGAVLRKISMAIAGTC